MDLEQSKYSSLINEIGRLLQKGREQATQSVNTILVQTYWLVDKHIVEFEQGGKRESRIWKFSFRAAFERSYKTLR
ncbi:DUF1016 N-terminal domain-containing protein [Elizabethkingia anophelis]|uniref:hypothetical protein n=1 Tax=Elizabethkingia anophelis TaxID=1117645 RepID=UPI00222697D2|nr:hypothetical protein [Elizabethkingia anophelis]MCW2462412.1 hypothetical protein [Elizabethkingia anophelis]MCW2466096.1 hypothetical protein [Elizabethkingia anophelis]MCW2469781.1 hypothetical protein [Elizabethkingia anophelis]